MTTVAGQRSSTRDRWLTRLLFTVVLLAIGSALTIAAVSFFQARTAPTISYEERSVDIYVAPDSGIDLRSASEILERRFPVTLERGEAPNAWVLTARGITQQELKQAYDSAIAVLKVISEKPIVILQ